jgi:porin
MKAWMLAAGVAGSLGFGPAICAQEPAQPGSAVPTVEIVNPCVEPANPFAGDLWTRPKLTGDWGGLRSVLAERGIGLDLYSTDFYQGVTRGGREQAFEYAGRFDYLLNIDGQKLGLWQGLFVNLHGETRHGQSVNTIDGLLTPSNMVMQFPEADGTSTALTGIKVTQFLNENLAIFAGKINTLDEYPLKYNPQLGGPGRSGFMNMSLVFNPIAARTIVYSAAGAGVAVLENGLPVFGFSVFDPEDRTTKGFENLYERGVVLVPDLTLRGKIFDRPSLLNLGGTYSTASYTAVDPSSYLPLSGLLVDGAIVAPEVQGSWCLYANGYHALVVDPCNENRHWGLFVQSGLADGNPNPIRYSLAGGIGGSSPICGRDLDVFGVGFFHLGLSDNFKNLASVVAPLRDEYGVEAFYNFAITPWCRLTTDIQVVRPSNERNDTAIIAGLRLGVSY